MSDRVVVTIVGTIAMWLGFGALGAGKPDYATAFFMIKLLAVVDTKWSE